MKKTALYLLTILLTAALLLGCGSTLDTADDATEPTADQTEVTTESDPVSDEEETVYAYEGDGLYGQQIGRYYTALSEQWDLDCCFENGLSGLTPYYYEGDPLNNVGFARKDLDNDGVEELFIGAILNAETDPSVFEIWTLVDGEPVMLAQGGSDNRYVLEYVQEDDIWYVVHEASDGAARHADFYLMVVDGKLEVMQGIVFDAVADPENPWFMSYDTDWDVSNDEPIDEDMANAIIEAHRSYYTALEYTPYSALNH